MFGEWMNIPTLIVLLIVLLIVGLAIRSMRRELRRLPECRYVSFT